MKRLEPGMLIQTNYSGPYRIKSITRDCTCPRYIDQINMANPPRRPPHLELVLTKDGHKGDFFLGGFDEKTLLSIDKSYCGKKKELGHDWIEILDQDKPVQLTMF